MKNAWKQSKNGMEVEVETGIIDYLLLLVFLVLVFLFYSLEIIAQPFAFNQHHFVFFVLHPQKYE